MYNADEVAKKLQEEGYEINKRTVNYYAFEKKLFEVEGGKNCFTDKEVKKIKYIKDLQQYTTYTLQQIKDIINRYTDEEIMDIIGDKLSKAHTHYGYGTKDNSEITFGSYNGYSDSLSASSNLCSYQNYDSSLLNPNFSHPTSSPFGNNMNYAVENNNLSKPDNSETLFGSSNGQGVSRGISKSLSSGISSSEGCSTSSSCGGSSGIGSGSGNYNNHTNSITHLGGGYNTTPQLVERTSIKIPINDYITLKVYNYPTNEKVVDEIVEFINFKINEQNHCGYGHYQGISGYSGKYRKFNYKEYSINFEFVLEIKEDECATELPIHNESVNKTMLDEIINFIKFKTKK